MPKNKGKGGKTRRRGKNESFGEKRELVYKEEGTEYAQVLRMLGNGRLEAYCFDGNKRLCHIRGKMQKKVWINVGDIVLVSLRDFEEDKCDVIYKYNSDEARVLKAKGELPENAKLNEGNEGEVDDNIEFIEGDEEDESGEDEIAPQPRRGGNPNRGGGLDIDMDEELNIDDI